MAPLQKLKGLDYKTPKTSIVKNALPSIPDVKYAKQPVLKSTSLPKNVFKTNINQDIINDVQKRLEESGQSLSGPLKGTQPVIQGDPRYSEFYNYNKFGNLSTNIDINNPEVQKQIILQAEETGKAPQGVLEQVLSTGGSFLQRFINGLQVFNLFEWGGVVYDAADIKGSIKDLDDGKVDFSDVLSGAGRIASAPFKFVWGVGEKFKDDIVDGVFGNGLRDQADRWRLIERGIDDLKSFVDVGKKYANENGLYEAGRNLEFLSDQLQKEHDIPLIGTLQIFDKKIQIGGKVDETDEDTIGLFNKFQIKGFANDLTDFIVGWKVDPMKFLKAVGLTKGPLKEVTFFNKADLLDKVADIGKIRKKASSILKTDKEGFIKLRGFINKFYPNEIITPENIDRMFDQTLQTMFAKLQVTENDIMTFAKKQPDKWLQKNQTLNDFLDPKNLVEIKNKFDSVSTGKLFVGLNDEGGELLRKVNKNYYSKYDEMTPISVENDMDDLIARLEDYPIYKMAEYIRKDPDRYLYDSKKDYFDFNNRFIAEAEMEERGVKLMNKIMERPITKLSTSVRSGLGEVMGLVFGNRNQALIMDRLNRQLNDIVPYINSVDEMIMNEKIGDSFKKLGALLNPKLKDKYVEFFERHIDDFNLSPQAKQAFYADKYNAIPMIINDKKGILAKYMSELPEAKQLQEVFSEAITKINNLRRLGGVKDFKGDFYYPRQFPDSVMPLPYHTEKVKTGETFLDAQSIFLGKDTPSFNNDPYSTLQNLLNGTKDQIVLNKRGMDAMAPLLKSGSALITTKKIHEVISDFKKNPQLNTRVARAYFDDIIDKANNFLSTKKEKQNLVDILNNRGVKAKVIGRADSAKTRIMILDDSILFKDDPYKGVMGIHAQIDQDFPGSAFNDSLRSSDGLDVKGFKILNDELIKNVDNLNLESGGKFGRVFSNVHENMRNLVAMAYHGNVGLRGFGKYNTVKELLDGRGIEGLDDLFRNPQELLGLAGELGALNTNDYKNLINLYEQAGLIKNGKPVDDYEKIFGDATPLELEKSINKSVDDVIERLNIKANEVKRVKEKLLGKKAKKEQAKVVTSIEKGQLIEAQNTINLNKKIDPIRWYDNTNNFVKKMYSFYSPSIVMTSASGNLLSNILFNGFKAVRNLKKDATLASKLTGEMTHVEKAAYGAKGLVKQAMGPADMGNWLKNFEDIFMGIKDEIIDLKKIDPEDAKVIQALRKTNDYRNNTTALDFGSDFAEVALSKNRAGIFTAPGEKSSALTKMINADPLSFMYLNRWTDQYYKISIMRNYIDEFVDIDVAVQKFNEFFKTYKDLPPIERMIARRGFMFYLFQRNNFVNYFKALGTRDHVIQRTALMIKLVQAMQDPELKAEIDKLPANDWRRNVLWVGSPDWFALGGNSSFESALQTARLFSVLGGDFEGSLSALEKNANYPLSIFLAFGSNKDPFTGQPIIPNDMNMKTRLEGWTKMRNNSYIELFKNLPKEVQEAAGFFKTVDANTKQDEYILNPYLNYMLHKKIPIPIATKISDLASDPDTKLEDWIAMFTTVKSNGLTDLANIKSQAEYAQSQRIENLMNQYNLGRTVETFSMNPLQKQQAGLPMSIDQYTKASAYATQSLPYKDFNIQYNKRQEFIKAFKKSSSKLKKLTSKKAFSDSSRLY